MKSAKVTSKTIHGSDGTVGLCCSRSLRSVPSRCHFSTGN